MICAAWCMMMLGLMLMWCIVCGMFHTGMLYDVCCMMYDVWFLYMLGMHAVYCMLHVVCCMLYAV